MGIRISPPPNSRERKYNISQSFRFFVICMRTKRSYSSFHRKYAFAPKCRGTTSKRSLLEEAPPTAETNWAAMGSSSSEEEEGSASEEEEER